MECVARRGTWHDSFFDQEHGQSLNLLRDRQKRDVGDPLQRIVTPWIVGVRELSNDLRGYENSVSIALGGPPFDARIPTVNALWICTVGYARADEAGFKVSR